MKKVPSELIYISAILLMALSVNMVIQANFGVSMIVGPAYEISLKASFLTYGQSEYVVEGLFFVLFCILLRQFKIAYLSSFLTGFIYATVTDLFALFFTGGYSMPVRIIFFIVGNIMTALAVALFFHSYIYPSIYDFFVKVIPDHFNIPFKKFKTCFDLSFLAASILLSFLFFHKLVGVGIGTIIVAICNGTMIDFFNKLINKHIEPYPYFTKLSDYLNNALIKR